MFVSRLDHLVLTVGNVEVSCKFYNRVLGLEIIDFGEKRKALKVAKQKINLHQVGEMILPRAHRPLPGSADVCFVTEKTIKEMGTHLAACGVAIELGPVTRQGALGEMTSLYLRDPDLNLIEISRYE